MFWKTVITTLFLALLSACLDEDFPPLPFFTVETTEASFRENGIATFRGSLDGITFNDVNRYRPDVEIGFLLSAQNPDPRLDRPANVEKLTLGELESNDDFIFEKDDLSILSLYYVRAFARIGERVQYGEVKTIAFSDEVQVFISTASRIENNTAEVTGIISGLARLQLVAEDHGFVFSDREEEPEVGTGNAVAISLNATNKDGSFSKSIGGLGFNTRYYVRAFLKIDGEFLYSDSSLSLGIREGWKSIKGLEGKRPEGIQEAVGWGLGNFAYIGLGCPEICLLQPQERQIWMFDPAEADSPQAWSAHSTFNFARVGAVAFSIGTKLYAGLGKIPTDRQGEEPLYLNDFWVFDTDNPAAGWTPADPFIGAPRAESVAFVIDGTAYVGTGLNTRMREMDATSGAYFSDFYAFHPDMGWWTVDSLPIQLSSGNACNQGNGRERAVAFAINGWGYVGTGYSRCGLLNDLWVFDPGAATGQQWTYLTEVPGRPRRGAVGFAIEDQQTGYIGTGSFFNNEFLTDFWAFDPTGAGEMGYWTPMTDFQGQERSEAVGFSIENKGYVGFGVGITFSQVGVDSITFLDFWEFTPRENF